MVINQYISAMCAQSQLKINEFTATKDMEKLAYSRRITKPSDDTSGLAVSEKLKLQIRGLNQTDRNTENGNSFIRTTEDYLQETANLFQRLRKLAVRASNGIYSDENRMQIQVEVSRLVDELDRIASHAQFSGMNLLTRLFAQANAKTLVVLRLLG